MNKFISMVRLCNDPVLRDVNGDTVVVSFRGAIANRKKNASTGQFEDDPIYMDFEAWQSGAKVIADRFRKGDYIIVEGGIRQDTWEDKNTGQKRSKHFCRILHFYFPPRTSGESYNRDYSDNKATATAARSRSPQKVPAGGGYDVEEENTDDLPF